MTAGVPVLRAGLVAGGLALWFLTQRALGRRLPAAGSAPLEDPVHRWTERWNAALRNDPRAADRLLLASSLGIDLLGLWVIGASILGASFRPFLGLLLLFGLRQVCQALCPLPAPRGMVWRSPGFPSLFVTYGVGNDFFFSGHTALAVYGAVLLGTVLGPVGWAAGGAVALFEIGAVLVLRAHYAMDVYAGIVTALLVHLAAGRMAPGVDRWIAGAAG